MCIRDRAKTIPNENPETVRCGYVLNSHPAVLDLSLIHIFSTLLQSGRSNSEIAYWLSRNYPREIETRNLETGDIADYRTTTQGMELEVMDAEEKRLAVLYFRWDEAVTYTHLDVYKRQLLL